MGIYRYTLRKETKEIDGLTIGRFGFAYKEHFWCREGAYQRTVAITEAAAERARDDLPDLIYAIMGEFKYAKSDKIAVFEIPRTMTAFSDGRCPGPVIGYISKVGRSYRFERAVEAVAA